MTAPLLIDAEPDTAAPLPHQTWHPEWRPVLARFAEAASRIEEVPVVSYKKLPLRQRVKVGVVKLAARRIPHSVYTLTWNLPGTALDERLRADMMDLARAFYAYELPESNAVILTRMLDEIGHTAMLHLVGYVRWAIAELAGDPAAAIAAPIGNASTGSVDGSFAMHSDMWIPALLFNVLNDVVPGQGDPLMMPMDEMWDVLLTAGMPDELVREMMLAADDAGECDYFEQFNSPMYEEPWADAVTDGLFAAAMKLPLVRGQGYFVNDRRWLHGRTALDIEAVTRREHRIYRLAFNNERLQSEVGPRRDAWREAGHWPACKS